jgi:hypothetical protein
LVSAFRKSKLTTPARCVWSEAKAPGRGVVMSSLGMILGRPVMELSRLSRECKLHQVHIMLCLWAVETDWSSCWTCSPSEKADRIAMPTITQALSTAHQHRRTSVRSIALWKEEKKVSTVKTYYDTYRLMWPTVM